MSSPVVYLLGFGEAGPLVRKSLASAASAGVEARYLSLPGEFADLMKPQPVLWRLIADTIKDEHDALVIWGDDALIVWDRALRARAVSHAPDFLWPLPLRITDEGIEIIVPALFAATGAFELSLYPLTDLYSFHHVVTARALSKLLLVSDIETLTLPEYMHQAWINFESVKAPDNWILHTSDTPFVFSNTQGAFDALSKLGPAMAAQSQQWIMGREALDAKTRNTLAASEFVRSNLDQTQHLLGGLMTNQPYYGFWPVKAGRADGFVLPCAGYHPVVAAHIWRGGYHTRVCDLWSTLFCQGAYDHVVDVRDDGHLFGLLFAAQQKNGKVSAISPSLREAGWAQAAIEANQFSTINLMTGVTPKADKNGIAVATPNDVGHLWGKMDIFIPLDGNEECAVLQSQAMPTGYIVYAYDTATSNLNEITSMTALNNASALIVVHRDHQTRLTGGRA